MTEMVERIDDYGRPAWIALMVVGFILFWPVGLAILAFLLWSGRMGCGGRGWASGADRRERFERKMQRMREKFEAWGGNYQDRGFPPTGNRAFDEYRSETLKRLEEEARDFGSFLDRLRMAKDKAEFDQFMSERRSRGDVDTQNNANNQPPGGM
jgi:hypothetical protein